ncbi:hypothetical protein EYM_05125 [Ignicoccus islandicus DSM 13165]|uniref:Methyltransferase domain-containing protein n=1 Tax=Ignicoccus islandicus DSM 13165 TaxID=940295 RepID=A0A0U2WLM9_9CREN|nr:methyltransferase domain-containing protein [Ignicoccus islandicus]ALU11825.1 hypothetical protein EYM_05125 [Ignicoccus islandicus DSM 13165]
MKVRFRWKGYPVVSKEWIESLGSGSIDENGTKVSVEVRGENVEVNGTRFRLSDLKEGKLYAVTEEGLVPLEIRTTHYFKLKPLEKPGHPTLEIDGIHMHQVKNVDPWRDTLLKVAPLKIRPGMKVLDTCMGLGYTAIASLLRGAEVVTIELNEEVIELAQWNPWSKELEGATVLKGDAFELINEFEDESFDRVIHDPPVITMAGELYSRKFYAQLYRVMKEGGVLFHYTGNFGRSRGVDLARGVAKRLTEVGFKVRRYKEALGVIAIKT